jgi:predicted NUDIX family NTP pyrophosphohydrolase
MKQSSGTLLYRTGPTGLEVLLVHPSGNYNRHKPWSIPKGEPEKEESDMEAVARRETLEESGMQAGALVSLGHIEYAKSGKRVHCYAGPAPENAAPSCASWEVDQARFLPIEEARSVLHPDQRVFLDRLLEYLKKGSS